MALLETVKQMQSQGIADTEVIQRLQEQGFNPKDIDEAISQSKIKAAISQTYETNGQESVMNNAVGEMQPSITQSPDAPVQQDQTQYIYTPEQTQYAPEGYGGEYYQTPQQNINPETITEISEQIVAEKTSDLKKAVNLLSDFKTLSEARISALDARLKKIETTIEKLQDSIIGRVGEYGQALQDIKDEMGMMQESFSKVVDQAVGNSKRVPQKRPVQEQTPEEVPENQQPETKQQRKKSHDGFENYLIR